MIQEPIRCWNCGNWKPLVTDRCSVCGNGTKPKEKKIVSVKQRDRYGSRFFGKSRI